MRRMKRLRIALLLAVVTLVTAAAFRVGFDAGAAMTQISISVGYAQYMQNQKPALDLPTLTTFDGDIEAAVTYFNTNYAMIEALFAESHPQRLAALYSMYVIHTTKPYGEMASAATLEDFLESPYAHCGGYGVAQGILNEVLGLTSRALLIDGGDHAFIEVLIDDNWEVFDSTVNLWVDRSLEAMLRGEPRAYRAFYTPVYDPDRASERTAAAVAVPRLRQLMKFHGFGTTLRTYEVIS